MSQSNSFKAGAGKAAIVYPDGFFPYRGFGGRRLIGIHDDIHARALLLENDGDRFLIVSLELGDITDEWVEELSWETGVPADHIWLTATHTHEAPYANSTWGDHVPDGEKTEPFCRCCKEAILTAYRQALAQLCPARLYYSEGQAWVNVNRDVKYEGCQPGFTAPYITGKNLHGYSDHTVSVLRLEDLSGRALAYVVGYGVHSSVLFHQYWGEEGGMLISGDLSGAAMRYVEERTDAVALHLLGCAGDQNPRFSVLGQKLDRDGNVTDKDYGDAGYALLDVMADEWGGEILRADRDAQEIGVSKLLCAKRTVTARTKEKWEGGPPMSLPVGYEWTLGGSMDLTLRLLVLGGVALLGIPGELVASEGSRLKQLLLDSGFSHAMVVTQANGCVQYMADDEGYALKTFEATQSHFAPGIGRTLAEGAKALAAQIRRKEDVR